MLTIEASASPDITLGNSVSLIEARFKDELLINAFISTGGRYESESIFQINLHDYQLLLLKE